MKCQHVNVASEWNIISPFPFVIFASESVNSFDAQIQISS